jgi:hypothetical protein
MMNIKVKGRLCLLPKNRINFLDVFFSYLNFLYKRVKTIKPAFKPLGSIQYDQRNSRIGIDTVSITTLQGRLKLPTRIGEYQKARFDRVRGQCDLIYRNTFCIVL